MLRIYSSFDTELQLRDLQDLLYPMWQRTDAVKASQAGTHTA